MNDSDPLFILELLITPQPIAYPPQQASHSHSRHYFIKRVRLQWAFMNNAVIRCGACNGWAHHQRREQDGFHCCLEVNHLLWKGRDADVQQYREFLYNICHFVEQRATTYPKYLLLNT